MDWILSHDRVTLEPYMYREALRDININSVVSKESVFHHGS